MIWACSKPRFWAPAMELRPVAGGLPVNGRYNQELTISCGPALLDLEVASAVQKVQSDAHDLPDPSDLAELETHCRSYEPSTGIRP